MVNESSPRFGPFETKEQQPQRVPRRNLQSTLKKASTSSTEERKYKLSSEEKKLEHFQQILKTAMKKNSQQTAVNTAGKNQHGSLNSPGTPKSYSKSFAAQHTVPRPLPIQQLQQKQLRQDEKIDKMMTMLKSFASQLPKIQATAGDATNFLTKVNSANAASASATIATATPSVTTTPASATPASFEFSSPALIAAPTTTATCTISTHAIATPAAVNTTPVPATPAYFASPALAAPLPSPSNSTGNPFPRLPRTKKTAPEAIKARVSLFTSKITWEGSDPIKWKATARELTERADEEEWYPYVLDPEAKELTQEDINAMPNHERFALDDAYKFLSAIIPPSSYDNIMEKTRRRNTIGNAQLLYRILYKQKGYKDKDSAVREVGQRIRSETMASTGLCIDSFSSAFLKTYHFAKDVQAAPSLAEVTSIYYDCLPTSFAPHLVVAKQHIKNNPENFSSIDSIVDYIVEAIVDIKLDKKQDPMFVRKQLHLQEKEEPKKDVLVLPRTQGGLVECPKGKDCKFGRCRKTHPPSRPSCADCQIPGHTAADCRTLCHNCGKKGHVLRRCPMNTPEKKQMTATTEPSSKEVKKVYHL